MMCAREGTNGVIIADALIQAYTTAIYRVDTKAGAVGLRIGQPLTTDHAFPPFDRLAIATAYNPFSEPLDDTENAKRQRDLIERVELEGLRWLPAAGSDPSGAWPPEPSLAIFDPTDAQLDLWMEHFGQNAVVVAERSGVAELRLHPRAQHLPNVR